LSSVLSLLIGSILGLVQYRIKRLYAYSTISHLGFILLALSINNIEASRAFFFYIIQYSISNLNIFIILITIGYTLYTYINNDYMKLKDDKYSPIQFISQLKGFYFINPILALSFIITLFSFVGIPPLIGFFGKQMVLSAALDNGYLFTTLIAIITSVISAVYYLVLVKVIFFEDKNYTLNNKLFKYLTDIYHNVVNKTINLDIEYKKDKLKNLGKEYLFVKFNNRGFSIYHQFLREKINTENIVVSGFLSFSIALFTLFILSFILFDQELIRLVYIII
jgi:NADH-ubiquinone oxidoreductase chain 2